MHYDQLTSNDNLLVDGFSGALCVGCLATIPTLISRLYTVNGECLVAIIESIVI